MIYSTTFSKLIDIFRALPGVGQKSAVRMAYYILSLSDDQVKYIADTILSAKEKTHYCPVCRNITEDEICDICSNINRDKSVICVVERPRDVISMEKTGEFNGTYHVLHGAISPVDGISPSDLTIDGLIDRVKTGDVKEVIMANNPSIDGEATAMYIARLMKPYNVKVTRIAYGLPVGGDLEYADQITLAKALEGRVEI
ncbi:MAG: recombination protein RecR [Ruminococcaceae bacterium]|nr:recombination protein RecR [Oscillospiraceae bacterium]